MKNESGARRATRLLTGSPVYLENDEPPIDMMKVIWGLFICLIIFGLTMIATCSPNVAHASNIVVVKQEFAASYSLDSWANAIRKAEGNENYGILSVKCTKGEDCRRICKNTVRNNWKRYCKAKGIKMPYTGNQSDLKAFVAFIGQRYCPIGAENDPNGLNSNWQRNVYSIIKRA